MVQFNGTVACIDASSTATVVTDVCSEGGGAFFDADFFYVNWAIDYPEYSEHNINYKEAAMAALCV